MKTKYIILLIIFIFSLTILKLNKKEEKIMVPPKIYEPKLITKYKIPSEKSEKTIYLSFDDGPSFLTNQILDILDKYNVPATFFVVGSNVEKHPDIIKREYLSGHTVALHSYTHQYKTIYTSKEDYIKDLNNINQAVYNIIGHHSHIVRLPGGSSNIISKKYKKGVMTEITKWLDENGYYYFDWNLDSTDASAQKSKEEIYNNVVNNLKYKENIILMHDIQTKQTTVDALPQIIEFAKKNGYTFSKMNKKTYQIHHPINN